MKESTPEYLPEGAILFEGRYVDLMPALLAKQSPKLSPVSPAWVMDQRNENPDMNHSLWNTYFDTDFGVAVTGNYTLALPHSPQLRAVTPETRCVDYGIDAPVLKGANVYDAKSLILGEPLTEKQAHESPFWLDAADGNQNRLDKYVENAFRLGKDKYRNDKMMGIYVSEDGKLRGLVVMDLNNTCSAYGNSVLDDSIARLVGVREEVAEGDDAQKEVPSAIYFPNPSEVAKNITLVKGVRDGTMPAKDLEEILLFLGKFRKK